MFYQEPPADDWFAMQTSNFSDNVFPDSVVPTLESSQLVETAADPFDPLQQTVAPQQPPPGTFYGYSEANSYYDGTRTITDYFDANDNFMGASYRNDAGGGSWWTTDGRSGSWSGNTGYWEVGAALGIGLGLWGTGNGDWGISWNAGVGAYAIAGDADSVGAAIERVTSDRIVIGIDVDDFPMEVKINPNTGRIRIDDIGFSFGFFASDPQ